MTPRALDAFLVRLGPVLGPRLRTDDEALARVANDETGLSPGAPGAVLWPSSAAEVALVAREAAALGVGLVPRGAGTGKAGGCIPHSGGVVVDLSRMNRIVELRPQDQLAIVEPGVVTIELDRAAREHGYMYPPDPSSWESCTLGGNIATNAGGPRAVKYGVTQRYVWGLEVVLAGGDVLRLGRECLKGVAGYDLTSLFVGSEGTLGFITRATMHLVPAPPAVETAWLSFADVPAASRAAERIFSRGFVPRMCELLDATAISMVRPMVKFPIDAAARACLLLEMDGSEKQALEDLERACELAVDAGALDALLAKNESERDGFRRARRMVSPTLKQAYPLKLSDDVAVPRSRMPELLERAGELATTHGLPFAAYGHLGDGNVHVNLLARSDDERARALPLRRVLLQLVLSLGGTITGEHGIGIAKRDELSLEQSREVIELQRRLKLAFDPAGIMNPGKVLPVVV